MSCKFYGAYPHASRRDCLIASGIRNCALMVGSIAPCRMEMAGLDVDFTACELNGSARAIEFENYTRLELRPDESKKDR